MKCFCWESQRRKGFTIYAAFKAQENQGFSIEIRYKMA